MKVPYIDLAAQSQSIKPELMSAVDRILSHGQFILGSEVEEFEKSFAELHGVKHAIGVGSGTAALVMAMKALGIGEGDEVITASNPFLATASSIVLAGAVPKFCDVKDDMNIDPEKLESVITPRTKAIIPIHLTGRPADMDSILEIASKHNLHVIEDAAQAVSAKYNNQSVGSFGIVGCFSLHPLKNLNVCGDGGVITTNDSNLAEHFKKARNHGLKNRDECDFWSFNSRLDALQAALAQVKLKYLSEWVEKRREMASFYQDMLEGIVEVPKDKPEEYAVYHTFVIQCDRRNELKNYLMNQGIETAIHYPIPIHLQKAAKGLGYKKGDFPVTEGQADRMLSLPIYPELSGEGRDLVARIISEFYS